MHIYDHNVDTYDIEAYVHLLYIAYFHFVTYQLPEAWMFLLHIACGVTRQGVAPSWGH